jgi:hypothetical protein
MCLSGGGERRALVGHDVIRRGGGVVVSVEDNCARRSAKGPSFSYAIPLQLSSDESHPRSLAATSLGRCCNRVRLETGPTSAPDWLSAAASATAAASLSAHKGAPDWRRAQWTRKASRAPGRTAVDQRNKPPPQPGFHLSLIKSRANEVGLSSQQSSLCN